MKTVGVLLAAGHSRRFGEDDKLLATYQGRPLVAHAADALRQCQLDVLVAVVASDPVRERLSGFDFVNLSGNDRLQSDSLRAGLRQAVAFGATRAVVVLGDMPLVTPKLITSVMDAAGNGRVSAAFDGQRTMPPACFPESTFEALLSTTGDTGASSILRALPSDQLVHVSAETLSDVDVPGDLTSLPQQLDRKGQP